MEGWLEVGIPMMQLSRVIINAEVELLDNIIVDSPMIL